MTRKKQHNIEIIVNGQKAVSETREGGAKSKHRQYMRTAMGDAQKIALEHDEVIIRYQIVGAKGWAEYEYDIASGNAYLL